MSKGAPNGGGNEDFGRQKGRGEGSSKPLIFNKM